MRRCLLADPMQFADRQRIEQRCDFVLTHDHQSIRLAQIGGDLGHEPVRCDADRRRYSSARDNPLLDRDRNARCVAERGLAFSHVEECFVERQTLHERRVLVKDAEHRARHFLVALEARRHADRVRTAAQRLAHRHRGVHAVLAHFVAGGGDDTAAASSADDQRLATQLRIVECFNGRVERVHVDVQDRSHALLTRAAGRTSSGCSPAAISSVVKSSTWMISMTRRS
jgi:hypothetical protein